MPYLYNHVDIIPKIYTAFVVETADPVNQWQAIEALAIERIKSLKVNDNNTMSNTPAEQIAAAVAELYDTITPVKCFEYQPENLVDEKVRNTIISMCAKGKFIPFMLGFNKAEDKKMKENVLVVVAGIGEKPDTSFLLITINLPGMEEEIGLFRDRSASHIVYPMLFDVVMKLPVAVFKKDVMSVRTFLMDNSGEKINNYDAPIG